MITLKTVQTSFPSPLQSPPRQRKFISREKSSLCFCRSKDEAADDSSPPSGGDTRKQELLVRIAQLQAQKVRLTNFLDERSAYLTQFGEDANAEFDEIGQNALKELDEASSRIMEKLDSRMQAFEEDAEINRQEIEESEKVLEEFEEKIEKDRNEGLFFKNLGEKKPEDKKVAKVEAGKLKETMKENAGSKVRRNIYLGLMSLLAITIANAVFASTEVEWRKIAALGLIFVGLLTQLIYEQSLSSNPEEKESRK
ncbi:uncharacterized protein [Typha latifolia]|uniref:uncharacterized protein n=1 Tax=Typha latifolia TaxID=4733 RepID=UPI003C2AEB49